MIGYFSNGYVHNNYFPEEYFPCYGDSIYAIWYEPLSLDSPISLDLVINSVLLKQVSFASAIELPILFNSNLGD